jgi:hypothetical protein
MLPASEDALETHIAQFALLLVCADGSLHY